MVKFNIKSFTSVQTLCRMLPEVPPGKANHKITQGGFDAIRIM